MQTEGGLKSMGLQSPARLALSRNSSTNTLKQSTTNKEQQTQQPSPTTKSKSNKAFLFNQATGSSSLDLNKL